MTLNAPKRWSQRGLLRGFIYGSLGILLLCLFVAAFIFSETYLKKEQARESDSAELISHFFDSHYRGIREEMWTRSYDAIHIRIAEIAKQLGHASYDMILLNESEECVFRKSGPDPIESPVCEVPLILKAYIHSFKANAKQHVLQFDYKSGLYLYMIPIYVGEILKGYLYTALSDPYEFHPENSFLFVARVFGIPIICILFVFLCWLYISNRFVLKPYLARMVEMEKKQAVAELAGKVAHNIQSPLVVVKSVARNIRGIDETQRRLLISATSRIEKIANHLISHFTSQKVNLDSDSFSFLWPVLDSSVAEKTSVLGAKSAIDLSYQIAEDLYCAGIPIPAEEMAVIFSNLMNNAIESFSDQKTKRQISISVQAISDQKVQIDIIDTGKGIPADVLAKLESHGGTYGKVKGAGLGLKHAREVLERVGGHISILSTLGEGTTVTLKIPMATLPPWCPQMLDLSQAAEVLVLDDDPSVHLLWQQRLIDLPATYISTTSQFSATRFPLDSTFYILDYEIVGSAITGLDLITKYQLGPRALLVTSYFNEPEIQRAVEQAGAMMLPKFMINRIQIQFGDPGLKPRKNLYDLLLIDDDPMIHELWHFEASQQGKRLKTVLSLSELDLDRIDHQTPIFIDKNLGEGISGVQIAQELHNHGFKNISLTSGERLTRLGLPEFIRELRNKDFPNCEKGIGPAS